MQKINIENIKFKASQLESISKSLKHEITNLKTTINVQLNNLNNISKELDDAKNHTKSEEFKLQEVIEDSEVKSDEQILILKGEKWVRMKSLLPQDLQNSNLKYH